MERFIDSATWARANLNPLSTEQLRAVYRTARGVVVHERDASEAEFDRHVRAYVAGWEGFGLTEGARWVLVALTTVASAFSVTRFVPPSEQTLDEGGFLGGFAVTDPRPGEDKAEQVLAAVLGEVFR